MGQRKTLKIALSIILLIVLTGCESSLESTVHSYFPINIGNEWNFSFYSHNGDYYSSFSFKIVKKKTVNGNEYFGFDKLPPGFPDKYNIPGLDSIYVRQDDKGDIMLLVENMEFPYLVFSEASNKNFFGSVCNTIKNTKYYYAYESTNADIITAFGLLHSCYRIGIWFPQIADDDITIGFACGYGPVETYAPEGGIGRIISVKIK